MIEVRAIYGMKVVRPQMMCRILPPAPLTWREIAENVAITSFHILARVVLTLVLCAAAVGVLVVAGIPQLAPVAGVLIGFMVWR